MEELPASTIPYAIPLPCDMRQATSDEHDEGRAVATELVSVVIVTADSGGGVVQCISKILASTTPVEVVLVDNASNDGSFEQITTRFAHSSKVRLFRNTTNLGFGAACNRGAAEASGRVILLLNPDCMVETDTVERLYAVLHADSRIGLVGALQVGASGDIDPASRRRDPLLRRALSSIFGLTRVAHNWPVLAGIEMPELFGAPTIEPVDAVSGALMVLPRPVFDQLGGFDEGYFLHCEDLDLCRRVRDADFRVVCANDVRVVHTKGGSSRHRPVFVAWHKHRGMCRWFGKFDPAARNPLLYAIVWCGIWAMFALKLPRLLWRRCITPAI